MKPNNYSQNGSVVILLAGLVVALFPGTGLAQGSQQTAKLLYRALDASTAFSYEGVRIRQITLLDSTIKIQQRIAHRRPDLDRIEIIKPGEIRRTVLIRRGTDFYWWRVKRDSVVYHRTWSPSVVLDPGLRLNSVELVKTNYRLVWEGEGTVIGRTVLVIGIYPRYPDRPSKRVWIDEETGIPLKMEEQSADAKISAHFAFTEFRLVHALPDSLFDPNRLARRIEREPPVTECASAEEIRGKINFPLAIPSQLPPGFLLEKMRILEHHRDQLVHFLYTDGMARLSLFERERTEGTHTHSKKQVPRDTPQVVPWEIFTTVYLEGEKAKYSLVGDLSQETLLLTFQALRIDGKPLYQPPQWQAKPAVLLISGVILLAGLGLLLTTWRRERSRHYP